MPEPIDLVMHVSLPAESTKVERMLLAGVLISGRLPNLIPHRADFTPGTCERIWRAAHELAALGQPINGLSVWRHDNEIDPVEVCAIVADFPQDISAKHLDLLVLAYESERRRQAEVWGTTDPSEAA